MKKLTVTLTVYMDVPCDWAIIKDAKGFERIRIGESKYLDMFPELYVSNDSGKSWKQGFDSALTLGVHNMVRGVGSSMRIEEYERLDACHAEVAIEP